MLSKEDRQLELTEQERRYLAAYFDILIEMHIEYKRNHKGSKDENDVLLNLKADGQRNIQYRPEDLATN